jgi:hypothetical protein
VRGLRDFANEMEARGRDNVVSIDNSRQVAINGHRSSTLS